MNTIESDPSSVYNAMLKGTCDPSCDVIVRVHVINGIGNQWATGHVPPPPPSESQ